MGLIEDLLEDVADIDISDIVDVGFDIFGTYTTGQTIESQSEAQAAELKRVAEANAKLSLIDAAVAEKDALAIEFQTQVALGLHLRNTSRLLSKQRALTGKSGVAVGTGSPLDVMADSASEAAKDTELIKYEGRTGAQRSRDLANRYRLLAKHGLRDAAAQSILIQDAARDKTKAVLIEGAGGIFQDIANIGQEKGWWDNG